MYLAFMAELALVNVDEDVDSTNFLAFCLSMPFKAFNTNSSVSLTSWTV